MKVITSYDERVIKVLELLGVPTTHLREAHIHIKPDSVVSVDCVYFVLIPDKNGVEELKEITKHFQLVEIKEDENN